VIRALNGAHGDEDWTDDAIDASPHRDENDEAYTTDRGQTVASPNGDGRYHRRFQPTSRGLRNRASVGGTG
jgi:hypothetical protein